MKAALASAWTAALLGAVASFSGCMSAPLVRETPEAIELLDVEVATEPLARALLAEVRGVRTVSLEGTWNNDNTFSAECVLKGADDALTAVFLAPQMRLATLRLRRPCSLEWDRSPFVPEAFQPEYAIFDLAVFHLPVIVLRRALGPSFSVDEAGGVRRVTRRGAPVVSVTSLPDGGTKLENFLWKYEYVAREMQ